MENAWKVNNVQPCCDSRLILFCNFCKWT
jgi:hypothetical protein